METCENCRQVIGDLENPFSIENHVVCLDCFRKLGGTQMRAAQEPLDDLANAARQSTKRPARAGGAAFIICPNPNCRFTGNAKTVPKAKRGVRTILMLLWILSVVLCLINIDNTYNHRMASAVSWEQVVSAQEGRGMAQGSDPYVFIACVFFFFMWIGYSLLWHGKLLICPRCGMTAREK